MQFGTRKGDVQESSGNYLRNFQKGETLVRFLDEVDDWVAFFEHYNNQGRSFPCTEERDTCPGCTHPDEKVADRKRKYAAQLWLVKKDVVLPYRLPVTISDRMSVRAERNGGTILNRDYVVLKSGSGFDTEYDVDQEDKYPVDIAELKKKAKIDIQEALVDSFKENAPEGAATPVTKKGEEKVRETARTSRAADDTEDPPSEPARGSEDQPAQGDDDDLFTESQIRAMDKPQLKALCERAGVTFDDDDTRGELVEKLLEKFGE